MKNLKSRVKLFTLTLLVIGVVSISRGQAELSHITPNKFHGFTLGTSLADFSQKNQKVSENNSLHLFSSIRTTNMSLYVLKNQLTEGGDKIDIDFFFYNDSLSVMRVAYKDKQSNKELIEALKSKYGDNNRVDDTIYTDISSGASAIMKNLYWEKWACCILNLTSTDDVGRVYLTFAGKAAQVKIGNQELINKQKRIN